MICKQRTLATSNHTSSSVQKVKEFYEIPLKYFVEMSTPLLQINCNKKFGEGMFPAILGITLTLDFDLMRGLLF